MFASSTQETLLNDEIPVSHGMLLRSISTLDQHDFTSFIQDKYGACWGTFKFEDTLSDYSNDVCSDLILLMMMRKNKMTYILLGSTLFSMSMIILIYMFLRQFMISEWKLQSANIVILPVFKWGNKYETI